MEIKHVNQKEITIGSSLDEFCGLVNRKQSGDDAGEIDARDLWKGMGSRRNLTDGKLLLIYICNFNVLLKSFTTDLHM